MFYDHTIREKFFKYLDTVSVESPDYESLSYGDIEAWGKVWNLIKDYDPLDVMCKRNDDETDYRCWGWDVYVKRPDIQRGQVMYLNNVTGTYEVITVDYVSELGVLYCYYRKTKTFFKTTIDKLI